MVAGGATPAVFDSGMLPLKEWLFVKNDFFTLLKKPLPSAAFSETFAATVGLVSGAGSGAAGGAVSTAAGGVLSTTGSAATAAAGAAGSGSATGAAGVASTGAAASLGVASLAAVSLLLFLGNSKAFFTFWNRVGWSALVAAGGAETSAAFDSTTASRWNLILES